MCKKYIYNLTTFLVIEDEIKWINIMWTSCRINNNDPIIYQECILGYKFKAYENNRVSFSFKFILNPKSSKKYLLDVHIYRYKQNTLNNLIIIFFNKNL